MESPSMWLRYRILPIGTWVIWELRSTTGKGLKECRRSGLCGLSNLAVLLE